MCFGGEEQQFKGKEKNDNGENDEWEEDANKGE
jgi:hypothetical protein